MDINKTELAAIEKALQLLPTGKDFKALGKKQQDIIIQADTALAQAYGRYGERNKQVSKQIMERRKNDSSYCRPKIKEKKDMMRTTRKEIMNSGRKVIKASYCEIQRLLNLSGYTEYAYTCGVYGWNADVYLIEDRRDGSQVFIVTGYRPFGNVEMNHKVADKEERRTETWKGTDWKRQRTNARKAIQRIIEASIS